jgi:predicted permease
MFAAVAILTLGVGIGLNTALFSIINVMLFKPPAVERGEELVWLSSASTKPNGPQGNLTYPDVVDLGGLDVFAGTTAFGYFRASVAAGGTALRLDGHAVMDNFFEVAGVRPVRGRTFAQSGGGAGAGPTVVISFAIWQRLFDGRDAAVGAPIQINGKHFTVVGVAPRGFKGVAVDERADLWVALSSNAAAIFDVGNHLARSSWWLRGIGRLASGVSVEQAAAAARGRAASIARDFADSHDAFTVRVDPMRGVEPDERDKVKPLSAMLLGVTLTVLFIACANVANLLLARGLAQSREMAVRVALGASRWRLLRLQFVESAVLAAGGGACALLFSLWFTDGLLQLTGAPFEVSPGPDGRVLLFTSGLSVLTALMFGLTPVFGASNSRPAPVLKGNAPFGGGRPRSRLQGVLVAGQLALSMVLLLAAAVFLKSLISARSADVGFDPRDRVSLSFNLRMHGYTPERASAFLRTLLERVGARPGVRAATLAELVPLGGRVHIGGLTLSDRPHDPDAALPRVAVNHVWPRFFETMAIPIVRGRPLIDADILGTATTAVVSQVMAHQEWPGADPIGRRFSVNGPRGPFYEVVGVAADTIVDELTEDPMAIAYLPGTPTADDIALLAWVTGESAVGLRTLAGELRSLDGEIAIFDPKPMEAHIADRMDSERGLSRMLAVAGVVAVGLAAIGLYGVVAYTVTRRTREIGVRVALGARPADVVRLFVGDAARLGLTGLACGLPPAFGVTAVLASNLVGGRIGDPAALGAVAILLGVVVLIAAYVPARRALRVDPMVALRSE